MPTERSRGFMLNKIRSFVQSVRAYGLRKTLREKLRRSSRELSERKFERQLGINTSGNVSLAELGIDEQHRVSYEPSDYCYFQQLMAAAKIESFDGIFLDLGSGKGRVVIFAATYPFRRIIGVEISEVLQSAARENIERARPKLACQNIELITADAAVFQIPDDVNVIYLFNPFSGPILSSVFQHIRESLDRVGRRVTIVCVMPGRKSALAKELARHDWLTKVFECDFENASYGAIYSTAGQIQTS